MFGPPLPPNNPRPRPNVPLAPLTDAKLHQAGLVRSASQDAPLSRKLHAEWVPDVSERLRIGWVPEAEVARRIKILERKLHDKDHSFWESAQRQDAALQEKSTECVELEEQLHMMRALVMEEEHSAHGNEDIARAFSQEKDEISDEYEVELAAMRTRLEESASRHGITDTLLHRARSDHSELKEEFLEARSDHTQQLARMRLREADALKALCADKTNVEQSLSNEQEICRSLEDEVHARHTVCQGLEDQIRGETFCYAKSEDDLRRLEENRSQLEATMREIGCEEGIFQSKWREEEYAIADCRREQSATELEVDDALSNTVALRNEVASLNSCVESSQEQLEHVRGELEESSVIAEHNLQLSLARNSSEMSAMRLELQGRVKELEDHNASLSARMTAVLSEVVDEKSAAQTIASQLTDTNKEEQQARTAAAQTAALLRVAEQQYRTAGESLESVEQKYLSASLQEAKLEETVISYAQAMQTEKQAYTRQFTLLEDEAQKAVQRSVALQVLSDSQEAKLEEIVTSYAQAMQTEKEAYTTQLTLLEDEAHKTVQRLLAEERSEQAQCQSLETAAKAGRVLEQQAIDSRLSEEQAMQKLHAVESSEESSFENAMQQAQAFFEESLRSEEEAMLTLQRVESSEKSVVASVEENALKTVQRLESSEASALERARQQVQECQRSEEEVMCTCNEWALQRMERSEASTIEHARNTARDFQRSEEEAMLTLQRVENSENSFVAGAKEDEAKALQRLKSIEQRFEEEALLTLQGVEISETMLLEEGARKASDLEASEQEAVRALSRVETLESSALELAARRHEHFQSSEMKILQRIAILESSEMAVLQSTSQKVQACTRAEEAAALTVQRIENSEKSLVACAHEEAAKTLERLESSETSALEHAMHRARASQRAEEEAMLTLQRVEKAEQSLVAGAEEAARKTFQEVEISLASKVENAIRSEEESRLSLQRVENSETSWAAGIEEEAKQACLKVQISESSAMESAVMKIDEYRRSTEEARQLLIDVQGSKSAALETALRTVEEHRRSMEESRQALLKAQASEKSEVDTAVQKAEEAVRKAKESQLAEENVVQRLQRLEISQISAPESEHRQAIATNAQHTEEHCQTLMAQLEEERMIVRQRDRQEREWAAEVAELQQQLQSLSQRDCLLEPVGAPIFSQQIHGFSPSGRRPQVQDDDDSKASGPTRADYAAEVQEAQQAAAELRREVETEADEQRNLSHKLSDESACLVESHERVAAEAAEHKQLSCRLADESASLVESRSIIARQYEELQSEMETVANMKHDIAERIKTVMGVCADESDSSDGAE